MAPLTRPGLDLGNGQQEYFDNPAARAIAFAQMARAAAAPQAASLPDQLPPAFYGDAPAAMPEPEFLPSEPAAAQPQFVQPTFRQATTDQFGNARVGPGLTKLGKLIGFLRLAGQGALDAAAGGALNAPREGQSTFGEGVNAAEVMPVLRAQRQQALARGALENEQLRANTAILPLLRAATLARQQAQTRWFDQRANANDYKVIPGVGLMRINPDGSLGGIVPGTTPEQKQQVQNQNTPEGRKAFAEANPDLFTSDEDRQNFILGKKPEKYSNTNEWEVRMRAAQGDPEAIALLRQKQREEESLAEIRHNNESNGQPKPKTGTPGQFQQATRRKDEALRKLQGQYKWNPENNSYENQTTGESLTPEEWQLKKQDIQDQYEEEVNDLGGTASHYQYPVEGAKGGAQPEAQAQPEKQPEQPQAQPQAAPQVTKGTVIRNPSTGERRQWNGSQWVTITPARQ